ncbi:MAG: AAA family ATPase [Kiritimatiellae bacterium]|nr:AAA family ATPase [Kiritimatiellia bacterium]
MKITALEVQNVKRVKAVALEPSPEGLTVVGGRNGQGKTSVLDAIAYALGGERLAPTNYRREGAAAESRIRVETDDGLIIERKGKNAALTVTDSTGRRGGQKLLDAVVGRMSIDLPSFLNANDKWKADILLKILGVGDELERLEKEEKAKYDLRTATGRMADQKEKAAAELPWHEGAPEEEVSAAELIRRQQTILAENGAHQRLRDELAANKRELDAVGKRLFELAAETARLKAQEETLTRKVFVGEKTVAELKDESTAEVEASIAAIEETNAKVRENQRRREVLADAEDIRQQYEGLTREIEELRARKTKLLEGADLPFPGLSVQDGKLTLDGKAWDCMSSSKQLIVATAIAARLAPDCKFVLADKLEMLDLDTLAEYDAFLKERGLQCIGTRVSTGGECSIVIEDGMALTGNGERGTGNKEDPRTPEGDDDFTLPDEV